MFLPPEILLDSRTKATESVVGVHHNMDNGVDESTKNSCSGVCVLKIGMLISKDRRII